MSEGNFDVSNLEAQTFGCYEVSRLLDVNPNELRYWHRIGLAPASATTGGGKQRRYTLHDLQRVRVVQALRSEGVKLRGRQLKVAVARVMGNLSN